MAKNPIFWETPFGSVEILRRAPRGPLVKGPTGEALMAALGRLHAEDRRNQCLLARAQLLGRLGEIVKPSPGVKESDIFMRLFPHRQAMDAELSSLEAGSRALAQAYVWGFNQGLFPKRHPWSRPPGPEKWLLEDSLLIARTLGLTSWFERRLPVLRVLAKLLALGTALDRIKELFPETPVDADRGLWAGILSQLDLDPTVWDWMGLSPRWRQGAFWGVEGSFSISGKPLLAGAYLTQISRLPSVFYEVVLQGANLGPWQGLSLPGVPAFLAGRTAKLSWMLSPELDDVMDLSFHKREKDAFLTEKGWMPFRRRTEAFALGKREDFEHVYLEASSGHLWPFDPAQGEKEGTRLSFRWAGERSSGTLNALLSLFRAESAAQAAAKLNGKGTAVLEGLAADLSALEPLKAGAVWTRLAGESWLPVPHWKPRSEPRAWKGTFPLSKVENGRLIVGFSPGAALRGQDSRLERLRHCLLSQSQFGPRDFHRILLDDFSLQGQKVRTELRFLFPESALGQTLRNWSGRTSTEGAEVFDDLYSFLITEIFSGKAEPGLAEDLSGESTAFAELQQRMDRILFSSGSSWFEGLAREDLFARILKMFFQSYQPVRRPPFFWQPLPYQFKERFFRKGPVAPLIMGRSLPVPRFSQTVGSNRLIFGPSVLLTMEAGREGLLLSHAGAAGENPGRPDGYVSIRSLEHEELRTL